MKEFLYKIKLSIFHIVSGDTIPFLTKVVDSTCAHHY